MTAIEPGLRLAGRYRVEELLLDADDVRSWRAVDEVLSRSVLVQTLPIDDARTEPVLAAARAAALVHDPRFLRVLDASMQEDWCYLIREWLDGHNLTGLLEDSGPLPPERAGALAREVAEALTSAHEQGLAHCAVTPDSVIIGRDGAVKITGLATDAVLRGIDARDPALEDARGTARILYAALTGRWAGAERTGLVSAPRLDGHLPSPRQVRAGIPRLIDEVCDRVLGDPPRHQAAPLRSPAEVSAALAAVVPASVRRAIAPSPVQHDDTPPALVPTSPLMPEPPTPVPMWRPAAAAPAPVRRRSGGQMRLLGVVAGALFLVGGALFGLSLLLDSLSDSPGDGGSAAADDSGASSGPVQVVAAEDFDPYGDDKSEHPDEVAFAHDGDPSTAWETQEYNSTLEALGKPGVGLILDIGDARTLSGVELALLNAGADVEVRVAPADSASAPADADAWQTVGTVGDAAADVTVDFDEPVETRFVLIWFTALAQDGANYRGGVREAVLNG